MQIKFSKRATTEVAENHLQSLVFPSSHYVFRSKLVELEGSSRYWCCSDHGLPRSRVGFTRPYIDSGVSVLVRKDLNIEPLETLDSSEFTLANLDTAQRLERQQRFLPDLQVLTMDTPSVNGYAVSNDWFNVLPGT